MDTFLVRIHYTKTGNLRFLSHLELTRALERMVRRAGLPFAKSQGFSPHMKLTFGLALPVGVGSFDEIFDVELTSYVNPNILKEALTNTAHKNLEVKSCAYINKKK